ncbi:uncharacterized protein LOC105201363 isoform X2 [Solenopsis invicta]|uniref:uncharacterized protein LOC105201363 isoform X2 n=1 Tax=Solenopsis invicta TaxID=13686 RepID=UPI000595DF6A|nr:uncharacterized protein LOC105201363 isoform X2 [Solenopsis invicta]
MTCGCRSLIQICAYLAFITIAVAVDQEECDKTKCPGPLAYYKDLNCIPVYKKEGDCCPTKYNCDHLKDKSPTKCYINHNTYEIGEELKGGDAHPCVHCMCVEGRDGIAKFICAEVDCFNGPTQPGCYRKNSPLRCCPGEEVCRNNVKPFCAKLKHPFCRPHSNNVRVYVNNCIPVYESDESPQTSCRFFARCQNDNDTVIHNVQDNSKSAEKNSNDEDVCYFGNMTMHRGDELNQDTDYSSVCVKCICEVPPVPTCQRLPNEECDVIKRTVSSSSGSSNLCQGRTCK